MAMPAKYPEWAVDDIINPTSGQPNVSDPDLSDPSKKLLGWDFKEYPPRQWFNYLHRLVNDWIFYVNEDLFGNALGGDVRSIKAFELRSHDAFSPNLNLFSTGYTDAFATGDFDITSNDDIDITALNNLMLEGADVWIDSNNYIYLDALYQVDIAAGEYILMNAGNTIGLDATTEVDINAPDTDIKSVVDINGMGGVAGLRLHTGKVMREYIEGGVTAIAGTYGNITTTVSWTWAWRRHDDIVDLTIGEVEGTINSNGDGLYVGGSFPIPDEIVLSTGGVTQVWCGDAAAIEDPSAVSHYSSVMIRWPDKTNWRMVFLDYTHPTGAFWISQTHFRYLLDKV